MTELLISDLTYAPEPERRFVVSLEALPPEVLVEAVQILHIHQGYYTAPEDGQEYRIRAFQDMATGEYTYYRTCKQGQGIDRQEGQRPIHEAEFWQCWPLTEGNRMQKFRYRIPLGDHIIDLDFFNTADGTCTPLAIAEVEFPSRNEAISFVDLPRWFGEEITAIPGYTRRWLAHYSEQPHAQTAPTLNNTETPPPPYPTVASTPN